MMMNELDRWVNGNINIPYLNVDSRPVAIAKIDYTKCADRKVRVPDIKDVIFSPPATIVLWADDTKTVVKCQEDKDEYSKEIGLAMCICKKVYGNKGSYNNVFKKFIKEY